MQSCHWRYCMNIKYQMMIGVKIATSLMFPSLVFSEIPDAEQMPASTVLIIDDMEKKNNVLGGKCGVYQRAPSRAMYYKKSDDTGTNSVLTLKYLKKNEGGPYGNGGWCGYYTVSPEYLDLSDYSKITFRVRAEGADGFKFGVTDKAWEMKGDSVKVNLKNYLPQGKVTTEWQKAEIPMDEGFVDWELIHAFSFNVEGESFIEGGKGTIYIDDIKAEK
ncbi:MAG: hypothetical protein GKR87_16755 [Kiritimatiellae bacterium]|nr:hypothetical protein [Kiritimatiellia bacterium]NKB25984.1 hypothetical protein [Kiritimatiellia bacterium]